MNENFRNYSSLELSNILVVLEDKFESLQNSEDIEEINRTLKEIELVEEELTNRD